MNMVAPKMGTVTIFLSEECPHEVLPTHNDDFSLLVGLESMCLMMG
jgi:hypothetical protein